MKLVILAMSCNLPFFVKEEELVKETWGKDIVENKYEDVSLYFLKSDENERIEGNYIYVNSGDDILHTMQKTMKGIHMLLDNGIEFDFLIRTNLSTYINIDVIRQFIYGDMLPNYQDWSGTLFTSEVVSTGKKYGPRGNFLFTNRGIINSIIYLYDKYYTDAVGLDDAIIGDMLYPAVMLREVYHGEMFKDVRYHKNCYIDNIEDIDPMFFFISFRYFASSMLMGYDTREQIEFETCRQIDKFIRSHKQSS